MTRYEWFILTTHEDICEKIMELAKRKGFFWPSYEIYGGEDHPDHFPVDLITLFTNVRDLQDMAPPYGPIVYADFNNDSHIDDLTEVYSNFIGIDKFHLTPKERPEGHEQGDNNHYCGSVWPPVWVGELDEATPLADPRGRGACNAIPSYGWTGNKCCGDDTGWNIAETGHAETSFKEFFKGTEAGCWSGNLLVDDERAMLIPYGMYYGVEYDGVDLGMHQVVDRDCSRNSCVFSIPRREEMFLSNPYPYLYNLIAIEAGERVIVNRSYLPVTPVSELKAENVPLQVQFKDGEFWACNPADYIQDRLVQDISEEDGERLFADDGSQFFGSCEVKGNYFCDHINGTDLGWSDTPIFKYPLSTNITLEDGTAEEISSVTIQATHRIHPKKHYNLIVNPGFEEV